MPIFSDHQTTSITVKVNQLCTPNRNEDIDESMELYISDLVELIKVQPNHGAKEAARAIRKKIKYGESTEEQIRALNLLEMMMLNSGSKIGPVLARDDKLLDVLKGIITGQGRTGTGVAYNKKIQNTVVSMALGWRTELDGLDGYKYMAGLHQFIPRKRKSARSRSTSNAADLEESFTSPIPSSPNTPSSKRGPPPRPNTPKPKIGDLNKKKKKKNKRKLNSRYADEEYRIPQIDYKREAPKIREVIANCHTHTTALTNLLMTLATNESPLENKKCNQEFEQCRKIRRKVLRYLQFVGAGSESNKRPDIIQMDEEFLGSLIMANEQLVEVFKKYETACGYNEENPVPEYDDEEDSDESYYTDESSEEESYNDEVDEITRGVGSSTIDNLQASVRSPPPPRIKSPPPKAPTKPEALKAPAKILSKTRSNDTVASDPFGDGNALNSHSNSVYS